jgi:DNA repair protein RecO (recombination protein O)
MLYTSRGIVLHQLKYAESSLIVKIYTEKFGLKSYIFRSIHKARGKNKTSFLQHLNLVEITADNRDYKGIQNPKEIRLEYPFKSIAMDIRKSSICLFVNEILYRSIKHEEPDTNLFSFIHESLIWLDEKTEDFSNFHLWFCIHLTHHLGFFPKTSSVQVPGETFNLQEGLFQSSTLKDATHIPPDLTILLRQFLMNNLEESCNLKILRNTRNKLIEYIILYYKWHIQEFGEINSHNILTDILA